MRLVVGLGNPGKEYRGTRHNIGSEVVERLAEKAGINLRRKWRLHARVGRGTVRGMILTLATPRTFMNLSGGPVAALLRWERCPPGELLVVSDDIALALGEIRIKQGGSSGGHKGLESIIRALGTEDFPRLRIGVGRPTDDWVGHVLGRFSREEAEAAEGARARAEEAVQEIITSGLDAAMNRFN